MAELLIPNQRVAGSIPVRVIFFALVTEDMNTTSMIFHFFLSSLNIHCDHH